MDIISFPFINHLSSVKILDELIINSCEKLNDLKITFYGHALFLIESGKGVKIGTDPYDEQVKTPLPELSTDIATSSHSHFDHAYFSLFKNSPKL